METRERGKWEAWKGGRQKGAEKNGRGREDRLRSSLPKATFLLVSACPCIHIIFIVCLPITHTFPVCLTEGTGQWLPTFTSMNLNSCVTSFGSVFSHGDIWKTDDCQSCSCDNGRVTCFSQICPTLLCKTTVLKKGQCCSQCAGKINSIVSYFLLVVVYLPALKLFEMRNLENS
mgnify:CR=1 FL=1